jgi:hypothetical protein
MLALPHTATHCHALLHTTALPDNLFYFILVYYHTTHLVLVGLPRGVYGLAILSHFISL